MADWTQGETPTVEVDLGFDPATVTILDLAIKQSGGPIIRKTLADSYPSPTAANTLVFPLTQADTLSLDFHSIARIQAHGLIGDDPTTGAFVTKPILEVTIEELLDPKVIGAEVVSG
jgi:hypothetical protein